MIGYFLYPRIRKLQLSNLKLTIFTLLFCLILVLTFNLNKPYEGFFMSMYDSNHGDFLWFFIPAFTGTFLLIFLSQIIPSNKALLFFGQNTLLLLGLNGIFHHFINNKIVAIYPADMNIFLFTACCVLITYLSLIFCYYPIILINKYFPQLFGKPNLKGPIFSNFEKW